MMKFKKAFAIGAVLFTMATTSAIAFASPSNPGIPARYGSGGRRGGRPSYSAGQGQGTGVGNQNPDGVGRGQGGAGRGAGIGGLRLQDGSCYFTES